ncbi:hypothetical protein H6G65_12880 [Microcystis elabens FACHB-917]|nr:hypothetical protein [Microcystis elabens FACHB-917]
MGPAISPLSRLLSAAAPSIAAALLLASWDVAANQAKAVMMLDVVNHNVFAEDMQLVNNLKLVPLGTYTVSYMPFNPSLAYPDTINFQARIHVKNNTRKTLNISKVIFDIFSTDSKTLHRHLIGRVTRHIPPKLQKLLHLRPGQELSSPANAASLRIHFPFASVFDPSSLASPKAFTMTSVQGEDFDDTSLENVSNSFFTAMEPDQILDMEPERTLEFGLDNVEVSGEQPMEDVPAPPLVLVPAVALRFAAKLRRRMATL